MLRSDCCVTLYIITYMISSLCMRLRFVYYILRAKLN